MSKYFSYFSANTNNTMSHSFYYNLKYIYEYFRDSDSVWQCDSYMNIYQNVISSFNILSPRVTTSHNIHISWSVDKNNRTILYSVLREPNYILIELHDLYNPSNEPQRQIIISLQEVQLQTEKHHHARFPLSLNCFWSDQLTGLIFRKIFLSRKYCLGLVQINSVPHRKIAEH